MVYIRYFETQNEFVDALINGNIAMPRLAFMKDTRRIVCGKMAESFIKVDAKSNSFLGDNENSFIIIKTK